MKQIKRPAVKIRLSRFPLSLFFIYVGMFLVMSGFHSGLLVLMEVIDAPRYIHVIAPVIYWGVVSISMTIFTRQRMKQVYEKPMQMLAKATAQVASGDFSVYVPPVNPPDKPDYLDVMIADFNTMVEALGSIETLKTEFVSNVSHEIKTPLAVIQNTAVLLKKPDITEAQRQEYVETIITASRRLSALITNFLKLNKLEKQTIQPNPERYDVCAQLAECAISMEHIWEQKNLELEADMEDEAYIVADRSLMELVWTNLLSNAIKFTEPGGKITLIQRTQGENVEITVQDTGCGMSEKTMSRIFDQFYQGDTSHTTEGNGLGLAISLRVIEMMNASISVKSKEGEGSAFTVTIKQG